MQNSITLQKAVIEKYEILKLQMQTWQVFIEPVTIVYYYFSIKESTMDYTCYRKIYDNYDDATVLC